MKTALVKAEYILRAIPFISDDARRPQICGIYVHPSPIGRGVNVVATNSHILLAQYDESGSCSESDGIIFNPSAEHRTALKGMKWDPGARYAKIEAEGFQGTLRAMLSDEQGDYAPVDASVLGLELIDQAYPDYHRCYPTTIGAPSLAAYNGKYMAVFGRAVPCEGDGGSVMVVCADNAESAALVMWPSRPDISGLLFPMRTGQPLAAAAPEWLFKPK